MSEHSNGPEGVSNALERIHGIVQDVLRTPVEDPERDLIEAGLIDSMAFVDLLGALERQFGITVPLERMAFEDFRSVQAMAALVDRERAAQ